MSDTNLLLASTIRAHGAAAAAIDDTDDTRPFSADDSVLRDHLRSLQITRVKKGSGGRSLAFKLTLADGSRAYFKPEQSVSSAHWYAELAAYYLDRALGLGRVPPQVGRRIAWDTLAPAAGDDPRVAEIKLDADRSVRGALIAWLPERLVPARTPAGWENWIREDTFAAWSVTPYQRAASYGSALGEQRTRAEQRKLARTHYTSIPAPANAEHPAALSDMIVFDFLTLNYDRWGGDNTNVLTLGPNGALIFLDNGDGFSVGPARRSLLDARLAPLQRFRKRTIDALRALDLRALEKRMSEDPLAPILDARAFDGLRVRRNAVLEHVAEQERRFGPRVYAW